MNGEVLDRTIRAVVADVALNVVTFISLTGNRIRIPSHRCNNDTWRFVQGPPAHGMICSRRGCRLAGVLRVERDTTPEWVCPRHMPTRTQATLDMSEHPGETTPRQTLNGSCPECASTDNGLNGFRPGAPYNIWRCYRCQYQWGSMRDPPPDTDTEWWYEHLIGLMTFLQSTGLQARRIDISPRVWQSLFFRHHVELSDSYGARAFQGIPVFVDPDLFDYALFLQTRTFTRATALPVSRLGGQPGRPTEAPNATLDALRGIVPPLVPRAPNPGTLQRTATEEVAVRCSVPEALPDLELGEEWISINDPTISARVYQVDPSRGMVQIVDRTTNIMRWIAVFGFVSNWRRIDRKTSYEHLLNGDDF